MAQHPTLLISPNPEVNNHPTARERYETYLASSHWFEQRRAAFAKWGKFCNACGATKNLHVHHLFYRDLYDCIPEDLMPLCEPCHDRFHAVEPPPYSGSVGSNHLEKRRQTLVAVRVNKGNRTAAPAHIHPPLHFPKPQVQRVSPGNNDQMLSRMEKKRMKNAERADLANELRRRDKRWCSIKLKRFTVELLKQLVADPKADPTPFMPAAAKRLNRPSLERELFQSFMQSDQSHEQLARTLSGKTRARVGLLLALGRDQLCYDLARIIAIERTS